MWQCCSRNYTDGIKACKICKLPKKTAAIEDGKIVVKREETPKKAKERKAKNKTARIVNAIPIDDKQYYTSTMPGGPRKL